MGLTKDQTRMIAVLLFGTMLVVLNQTLLTPALPTIMRDLGVTATTAQWLTSAYSLTEAVVIPLSAYLMGRFSTRQLYIGGFGLFTAGTLLGALAPAFPVLLLGRIMQAISTGVMMPMVFTLILFIFPREKRGAGMGLVTLIIGFAPAVGPSLSGVLVDTVGWRAIFFIVCAISVVVLALSWFTLKNFEGFQRTTFDIPSVILSTLGMVALLYGFSTFASTSNLPLTLGLIVAGAAILAVFTYRQLHLDQPLLNVRVLKSVRYRTVTICVVTIQAGLIGLSVITPLYVQTVLGYPATVSGLLMLPGAVLGAFAGMVAGRLFDRVGVRPLVLTGSCLLLIGICGLVTYTTSTPIYVVACVYTINTLAMQLSLTPMNTWSVNSLANDVIPHGNALSNTLNQVGGSFGTALIVSMAALGSSLHPELTGIENAFAGYHLSYCTSAAMLFCVILMIWFLVRDKTGARQMAELRETAVERARQEAQQGTLLVSQAMNTNVKSVRDTDTVRDAFRILAEEETSGIPVVGENGELRGFIADGDVMRYLGRSDSTIVDPALSITRYYDSEGMQQSIHELMELPVMRLATPKVVTVDADMTLKDACNVLAERRIKKVPVVRDGKLVGVLSRRNIIRAITDTADLNISVEGVRV